MAVYTGTSIVDYLKSIGQPSDFTSRSKLAAQYGIANYTGTAEQNLKLLDILRQPQQAGVTAQSSIPVQEPSPQAPSLSPEQSASTSPRFNSLAEFAGVFGQIPELANASLQDIWQRYTRDAGVVGGWTQRINEYAKNINLSVPNQQTQNQQAQIPQEDSNTMALLTQVLNNMGTQGKTINPNVQIGDAQILEFLKLAEQEVTPGFQAQLKTAREGIYRDLGFASDEVLRNEQQLERKYGIRLRELGEQQAEQGFALSGRRLREEEQLREETAQDIGAGRRQLEFGAGTAARRFAQQYGAAALPSRTIEERPQVISGISGFTRSGIQRPLYELSDDVYRGLVGEQEKARLTGIRSLAQQREELTRLGQASPIYSQYQPQPLTF